MVIQGRTEVFSKIYPHVKRISVTGSAPILQTQGRGGEMTSEVLCELSTTKV